MNNAIGRHERFSPAQIAKVVARYRQSGLGVAQFAQAHGLPSGRLHYWIYQKGRARANQPPRGSAAKPVFEEIQVATLLPARENWAAEVSLPGGLAVGFSHQATAEWIGAVVQALRRPC